MSMISSAVRDAKAVRNVRYRKILKRTEVEVKLPIEQPVKQTSSGKTGGLPFFPLILSCGVPRTTVFFGSSCSASSTRSRRTPREPFSKTASPGFKFSRSHSPAASDVSIKSAQCAALLRRINDVPCIAPNSDRQRRYPPVQPPSRTLHEGPPPRCRVPASRRQPESAAERAWPPACGSSISTPRGWSCRRR